MMPVLYKSIKECNSASRRALLYRAFVHTISGIPMVALVAEMNKVIPLLLDALSVLDIDVLNKDLVYSLLLVLSGFLIDEKGKEGILVYVHTIIDRLVKLISYPHMKLIRETAIQCLTAITSLPYTRIYPMKVQVLKALSVALDDKKRIVRQEAVKCRHACRQSRQIWGRLYPRPYNNGAHRRREHKRAPQSSIIHVSCDETRDEGLLGEGKLDRE
ncbi:hypothetical protein HPP92_007773 [Vanilla planifolia]|uniref:MMS19 nucleotide excision repair protein n=1 Tax=Vanilla planifolia TaxID=51239 RepID=A0A835V844_VANPL|nr:hypothetical protein HPP92_007773 [Vanilla planifolia]